MDEEFDEDVLELMLLHKGAVGMVPADRPDPCPHERMLWRSVIFQAYADATGGVSCAERDEARRWFSKTQGVTAKDMETVCEILSLSADTVRITVQKSLAAGKMFVWKSR